MTVSPGIEVLVRGHTRRLRGSRVALLAAAASVLPDLTHGLDGLLAAGVRVTAVLGPEHGFRGSAPPGSSEGSGIDPVTGVRIVDAYDRPMDAVLADVDADTVVVDLQHVGARFYTYESALHDVIAAARVTGARVVVCDRPNPITGSIVAGPLLNPAVASYVGRAPVPVRHGMTMGELALLFAARHEVADLVEMIPMIGWRRDMWFDETGLPWVPPSPNMPTLTTATCYPGTCLAEGTNLSVGRGTTIPFELVGAPWAGLELARRLRTLDLPGVAFRETHAVPHCDRYAGRGVWGVQLHVTDRRRFDPLRVGVEILAAVLQLWPERLTVDPGIFDRLAGSSRLREALVAGVPPADITAAWRADRRRFAEVRAPFLRYPSE